MASTSTACSTFLKLSPPPPPPTTRLPSQLIPRGRSDELSRSFVRRQLCMAGMATIVVIGLRGGGYDQNFSGTSNPRKVVDAMPDKLAAIALEQKESPKWSDSIQECAPWRSNSLQVVVPENLPRPYAHRRWEFIGNSGSGALADAASTKTAGESVSRKAGCFFM